MLLSSCETLGLDDTLSIVQDFKEDKELNKEGLDAVVANKTEEEAAAAKEENAAAETETANVGKSGTETPDNGTSEELNTENIEPNDEMSDEETSKVIDGKVTTPATESIRYSIAANESVGEFLGNAARAIGSGAAYVFRELVELLRELGIAYGPAIFKSLKVTVVYILIKVAKLLLKLGTLAKDAVYNYKTSMSRHASQISALQETCKKLEEAGATVPENNKIYNNEAVNQWSFVDGRCNFINSNARIKEWLLDSFQFLEKNLLHDIDQTVRFLNSTKDASPVFPMEFIQTNPFKMAFREQQTKAYAVISPYTTSYVYPHSLPNKTILMALLPSKKAVDEAIRTKTLDAIKEAYQSSGIFLAVGKEQQPVQLFNNYMNPKQLTALLDELSELAKLGYRETKIYTQITSKLSSLKVGLQQYLNWLQADSGDRHVVETYVDFIAMKQAFVTRVYVSAAMDSHDYLSTYLTNAKRFVRDNIKVLSANIPNSAE